MASSVALTRPNERSPGTFHGGSHTWRMIRHEDDEDPPSLTKNSLCPEGAPSSVTAVTFCKLDQRLGPDCGGAFTTSMPKILRIWPSGLAMVALQDTNCTLLSRGMSEMVIQRVLSCRLTSNCCTYASQSTHYLCDMAGMDVQSDLYCLVIGRTNLPNRPV